ncbi:putative glycerol-3-phosphate transporter 5 isoform X2 [Nematostella vectensis]|uniref:putative glycerol-3-phosphate transporter 5 isoform X2 n=1 Tax=Nematostella vectensis TaxID=45351 RepID=UPI0020772166|nr:putative glycerol-3-phosphate transporter 5 isoform X2 [Nematostella vectensis]
MVTIVQRRQALSFVIIWIAYASTYLLRKPLGVIKADLGSVHKLSRTQLGLLDTSLLLPYAVMQILLGSCGDKFGPRLALTSCLIGSALSMFSFGFWNHLPIFALLLFLNGTSQATAWPNCVKTLGMWFNDQQRTTIFGFFGTCTFGGGILGSALAVQLQSMYGPDMAYIFLIPSLIVGGTGLVVFMFIRSPEELGMQIPGKEPISKSSSSSPVQTRSLSYIQLWRLRMVPELSWTNFAIKLVRYCMYMWLPMYLFQALGYSKLQAGLLSTVFEIGGVAGSASLGLIISRLFGGRAVYGVALTVLGSTVFLAAFHFTSHMGIPINCVFMFLAGACNCGPDPYLSGSIAAEIGERENAQAAVSGLINGFGSIGTVVEGPVINLTPPPPYSCFRVW